MLALVNTPNGKAPVELRQIRRRRVVGDGVARSGREWRGGGVRQFLRRDDKHQLCRFPRRAKCALAELLLVHFGAGGAVCAGSCIAGVAGRRQVADAADRAGAELARHCAGCRRAARPACRREGGVSGGAVRAAPTRLQTFITAGGDRRYAEPLKEQRPCPPPTEKGPYSAGMQYMSH